MPNFCLERGWQQCMAAQQLNTLDVSIAYMNSYWQDVQLSMLGEKAQG